MKIFRSQLSFDATNLNEQIEQFELGSVDKAIEFRDRVRVVGTDGKNLGWLCDLDEFKRYGQGPYFYFIFIKYSACFFFLAGLICIAPMAMYSAGQGMGPKSQSNYILSTSVGNLKQYTQSYADSLVYQNQDDYNSQLQDEYKFYRYIAIATDCTYSLLLIFFCYWFRYFVNKASVVVDKTNLTPASFTLEVTGVPDHVDKEELNLFFKENLRANVNQINFAWRFNNTLKGFMEMANLNLKKRYVDKYYELSKRKSAKVDRAKEIQSIDKQIDKIEKHIHKMMPKLEQDNKGAGHHKLKMSDLKRVKAYVIFENSLAPMIIKKRYDKMKLKFCCGKVKNEKSLFHGKTLELSFPDHPDNIKWENLEISKINKFLRTVMISILSIVIMFASFIFIFMLNIANSQTAHSGSTCSDRSVKIDEIYATSTESSTYNQLRYCYCNDQSLVSLISNQEVKTICSDYLQGLYFNLGFSIVGGMVISFTNFVLRKLLSLFVTFQRYDNLSSEGASTVVKGLVAAYLNTVVVSLLSTAEFPNSVIPTRFLGSIAGLDVSQLPTYSDLYRDWYQLTGFKITTAMIISCFIPQAIFVILMPLYRCFVMWKVKAQRLQIDMNRWIKPMPFSLAQEYVVELTMFFVTLSFSSGLPILIWIGALGFFLHYWCNKIMFVRDFHKPPQYNSALTQTVVKALPFAMVLHLSFSIWTYGVTEIFPTTSSFGGTSLINSVLSVTQSTIGSSQLTNDLSSRVTSSLPLFILWLLLVVALIIEHLLYTPIRNLFGYGAKHDRDQAMMMEDDSSATNPFSYNNSRDKMGKSHTLNYDIMANDSYKHIMLLFHDSMAENNQYAESNVNTLNPPDDQK